MKKHKSRTKSKRPSLLPKLVILLILAGLVFVGVKKFDFNRLSKQNAADTVATDSDTPAIPTEEEKQQEAKANADEKQALIDNEATPAPTPPDATSKNISLSAQKESNGTVTVFTKLVNYSDGTCKLTTTNGTKTNTQSAAVMYQREASTCAGFSVPISSLGTGTWNLKLAVTSNGSTESKTITYEVK